MARQQHPGQAWLARETAAGRRNIRPVVVLGLVGVIAGVGQAWCIAQLLAGALGGIPADAWPWAAGFATLVLVRAGAGVLADDAAFAAGAAARRRLRSGMLVQLLGVGPAVLRSRQPGALGAIAIDRIEALDGLFSRWLPATALAVVGPAVVALGVLAVDPWAALILLGAGLLVPVGMAVAGVGAAAASQRQFAAMDRLQARFLDRVRGIATIVLFGRAADEAAHLQASAAELAGRTMRVLRVAFLSSAALDCAAAGALVVLAGRYAAAWHGGALRPAVAAFVLVLVAEFFAPLRVFAAVYQDRFQAVTAAADLDGLPAALPAPTALPTRTVAASGVSVAFDAVSYAWDPARGPVLSNLSFRVPAGQTVVLVGPSGAGKSTILELLLGFVQPDAGRVTINGADIASIVPAALARMTAWIGQNPVIFAGTIRDNIRFGREGASDAEVEAAALAARVGQFADALPQGLDTPLGEGGYGLSGGQAQRVAIARAFLKNAPLLLLDEPTAHLDPATEAEVFDSLRRLTLGRTVILASHSVAAHAFAGRRLDLRDGRTVPVRGVA